MINLLKSLLFGLLLLSGLSALSGQGNSSYSFIAAGHAYGSHDGENTGLHPALLESLYSGIDSTAEFILFTGDIVNHSTTESWQDVEREMDSISLPYYFVMGNHDDNETGRAEFIEKFGNTYYSFYSRKDLFIVLNSIEADRAISENQLVFLEEQISQAKDSCRNIFIFFHEIIWNSHTKYIEVRSNSRSRYDQVLEHSNYWEEVHPLLMERQEYNFYLIAGDVGGNPDAVSAFYDQWAHITFLASGMGEVADENYLLVHMYEQDSIGFELVALNPELSLPGIEHYSVPPAPGAISGPGSVFQGSTMIEYSIPKVFNAESYEWDIPAGVSGYSLTNLIDLNFDPAFEGGVLSVSALRDGFGKGPASSTSVFPDFTSTKPGKHAGKAILISYHEASQKINIECNGLAGELLSIQIIDNNGRMLKSIQAVSPVKHSGIQIETHDIPGGIVLISVSGKTGRFSEKILVR